MSATSESCGYTTKIVVNDLRKKDGKEKNKPIKTDYKLRTSIPKAFPKNVRVAPMKDHEQYLGRSSQEVVFDLLHSLEANYFFLKSYVPKIKRNGDRFVGFKLAQIPKLPKFLEIICSVPDKEQSLVGIFSQVSIGSSLRHIPMMDFSNSTVAQYGTDRVKEIMEALGQKSGVVLNSGRCYHFYGFVPASHTEWLDMMQNDPIFDEIGPKYLKRQIGAGGCTLRVSTNSYKPTMPTVVDILDI